MNQNFGILIIMAAIAIYNNKTKGGLVASLDYLMVHGGYTLTEAVDAIDTYDNYVDAVAYRYI